MQGGFFMNKQALAFISMFTLVLMLSIYYVSLETIPPQSNTPVSDITSVMAVLNEQNQEKKDTLKNSWQAVKQAKKRKKKFFLKLKRLKIASRQKKKSLLL